jgi:single-stranded-DNA-specific exonuclease
MQKRYILEKRNTERNTEIDKKYGTLIADILAFRNIYTKEDADIYFYGKVNDIMDDPMKLGEMEKAIDRIQDAIIKNQKIIIHADYDCDGIPGAVILSSLFDEIGYKNYIVSIPDRNKEGYGLTEEQIHNFHKNNADLIITIDLGISEVANSVYAKKLGIDIIITDHHTIGETIPDVYAIVHPKIKNSTYANTELCGAGVIFTLVRAFCEKYKNTYTIKNNFIHSLFDLVALATLSDMVLLTKENRALIKAGIYAMQNGSRPGIYALAKEQRIYLKEMSQSDLTFMIVPKINVASRMGNVYDAYDLLKSSSYEEALVHAKNLLKLNAERKSLVAKMVKEAKRDIAESNKDRESAIVVGNSNWRMGLLGLVATKLVEHYHKPVFVWGRTDDGEQSLYKGSCRGNGTINMHTLMEKIGKDIFSEFGGHFDAGGFSLAPNAVFNIQNDISERFTEVLRTLNQTELKPVYIDANIPLSLINNHLYKSIMAMGPFGPENKEPLFIIPKLKLESFRHFGKNEEHLELVFQDNSGQTGGAYTYFKRIEDYDLKIGETFHLITTLDQNQTRNIVKLKIQDIIKI